MDQIRTIADLVEQIQNDRKNILAGKVTDAQARNLLKGQALTLKAAEYQLQYARLMRGRLPEPDMLLLPRPPKAKPEAKSK